MEVLKTTPYLLSRRGYNKDIKNVNSFKDLSVSYNFSSRIISINYTLQSPGNVKLDIFNLKGTIIKTISDEYMSFGEHTLQVNMLGNGNRILGEGVYFIRLKTDKKTVVKKVTFIR